MANRGAAPSGNTALTASSGATDIDLVEIEEEGAGSIGHDPDVVEVADGDEDDELPKNASLQDDGSVILKLRFPLVMLWTKPGSDKVREERRDSFRFYRLNGEAMMAVMNAREGSTVLTGLAKSCRIQQGLFNAMFKRMDGADTNAAGQVLNFLLNSGGQKPAGPPTSP